MKCNLIVVDYLDVTFDLTGVTYKPFRKPKGPSPNYRLMQVTIAE